MHTSEENTKREIKTRKKDLNWTVCTWWSVHSLTVVSCFVDVFVLLFLLMFQWRNNDSLFNPSCPPSYYWTGIHQSTSAFFYALAPSFYFITSVPMLAALTLRTTSQYETGHNIIRTQLNVTTTTVISCIKLNSLVLFLSLLWFVIFLSH